MSSSGDRELDIVLVGATGFVGRLTAHHLATRVPAGTRVALAGRSMVRLAQTRAELGAQAQHWPLIICDVHDQVAVTELAARARVIVSTVGPYLRHGLPLVKACAAAGTDYADLTGETLFVRRSIDACSDLARANGARIVHSCGFDSVPSDLGVGLTAAQAAADGQGELTTTVLHVRSMRGGVSGGTIDSLRQQMIEVKTDPELRSLASDPLALTSLSPAHHHRRHRRGPVDRDPVTGNFQARFVMGGFNRQIVLRSNDISGGSYGAAFRYREVVDAGPGPRGALTAAAIAAATTGVMAGMYLAPTRRLLDAVLPDPGEGPSERTRRRGRFLVEVVADTSTGARYRTRIGAQRDPGYGATAVMLGESALSLANDANVAGRAGVLTPMSALGEALAVRLRANQFTVSVSTAD
ncbi:MAG: hypothetical protein QOF52_1527 [Propionibacteriaceae bacterium]|jgi:short subunit dehydrogenase-like uncharacterized protein|nr:enoyl-ACP reductase [Propionibacteriaceae bacterium]MDX6321669.1 hypothetical protein [Propionibacteriaceae bacterium]